MDRDELQAHLAEGRSLAEIGRLTGKHPSTVSYWVKKHGLQAAGATRHTPRGGLPRDVLGPLVDAGRSTREIAAIVGRSQTTTRHWLRRYGLTTLRPSVHDVGGQAYVERVCRRHGSTRHARRATGLVCTRCRSEAVIEWRRRLKRRLVAEAGGACVVCGYDRCVAALHFHHVDPSTKRFNVGARGLTRSLEVVREEVAKCVLLCANCHAEVEAGERELA